MCYLYFQTKMCWFFLQVVYNLRIFRHFYQKNYAWIPDIVKKSLLNLSIFLVWFLGQIVLIPIDQNVPQGVKCSSTPNLYATHIHPDSQVYNKRERAGLPCPFLKDDKIFWFWKNGLDCVQLWVDFPFKMWLCSCVCFCLCYWRSVYQSFLVRRNFHCCDIFFLPSIFVTQALFFLKKAPS